MLRSCGLSDVSEKLKLLQTLRKFLRKNAKSNISFLLNNMHWWIMHRTVTCFMKVNFDFLLTLKLEKSLMMMPMICGSRSFIMFHVLLEHLQTTPLAPFGMCFSLKFQRQCVCVCDWDQIWCSVAVLYDMFSTTSRA